MTSRALTTHTTPSPPTSSTPTNLRCAIYTAETSPSVHEGC